MKLVFAGTVQAVHSCRLSCCSQRCRSHCIHSNIQSVFVETSEVAIIESLRARVMPGHWCKWTPRTKMCNGKVHSLDRKVHIQGDRRASWNQVRYRTIMPVVFRNISDSTQPHIFVRYCHGKPKWRTLAYHTECWF